MNQNPYHVLADWLESEAREVRAIERQAYKALHDENDETAYRELMRVKALRLADLADNASGYMTGIDSRDEAAVVGRIERFSSSAATAIEIGSVFFMSALLYPEDYMEGENNDLENFAERVRSFG